MTEADFLALESYRVVVRNLLGELRDKLRAKGYPGAWAELWIVPDRVTIRLAVSKYAHASATPRPSVQSGVSTASADVYCWGETIVEAVAEAKKLIAAAPVQYDVASLAPWFTETQP